MINFRIEGKQLKGLVDTGANVSVISKEFWPPSWSTTEAMGSVKEVGVPNDIQHSAADLRWQDEEGQTGWFQPYVISRIAVNLWVRDVLRNTSVYNENIYRVGTLHSPPLFFSIALVSQVY